MIAAVLLSLWVVLPVSILAGYAIRDEVRRRRAESAEALPALGRCVAGALRYHRSRRPVSTTRRP